jgi:hypothetical protein
LDRQLDHSRRLISATPALSLLFRTSENNDMPAKKRELIEPHPGDKRYVRRDDKGQFKESDDVSRSLAQDVRKKASTVSKSGQGDRGDRK